jgi:DNA-damage-inducible protein J
MAKTAAISMRVEPELKTEAESVFASLGLSLTEAINVFLHMSVIEGGLPFEVKQPRYNAETERAMDEARAIMSGKANAPAYGSASELFSAIDD